MREGVRVKDSCQSQFVLYFLPTVQDVNSQLCQHAAVDPVLDASFWNCKPLFLQIALILVLYQTNKKVWEININ